ncbi:monofunctional biosynthetic peptidoglycan transglycosylase [Aquimarina rhabdastrellae]
MPKRKKQLHKISKLIGKCIAWFIAITFLWVLVYKWAPIPYTPLMGIRSLQGKAKVFKHDWVPIEKISPYLQLAVICSEDQKFLSHNGFDLQAIEKAIESNQKSRRIKGGSTISQQTAKNVFLWPHRSWIRKGFEVYFTFLIETLWSKERILEVYLNSIEMGSGVYGAQAASKYWFKKPANRLTRYEAAAIAAILPNPRKYRARPASNYIQRRKEWIVKQMRLYGVFKL